MLIGALLEKCRRGVPDESSGEAVLADQVLPDRPRIAVPAVDSQVDGFPVRLAALGLVTTAESVIISFSLAGFQVILIGRFWLIAED